MTRPLLRGLVLVAATAMPAVAATEPRADVVVVDAFEDTAAWSAHPADGVELAIRSDEGFRGHSLRLDFRFSGGGYAVARRAVDLDLPDEYAFRFRIRGEAPVNHLEFKLIDASGENVWWSVRRDMAFPAAWETLAIKRRQVSFAWGPLGGGEIRRVAALEFAITAGSGGAGTVWIDELELLPLPPASAPPERPAATASSFRHGRPAAAAVDGLPTSWSPARADASPWIALDLGAPREFGGLVVEWAPGRHARDYVVEASDTGAEWGLLREVAGGNGGRDFLYLPESEARHLRVRIAREAVAGVREEIALREIAIRPVEWAASREAFFAALAANAPRGAYPRGIRGEQSYWTVVGVDADAREGLLGEDGALETGPGRFSLEPFLASQGRVWTWADARIEQSLADACLPIPSVAWEAGPFGLEVTAFGTGEPGRSSLVARYRVTNASHVPRRVTLHVALRPFQVNPPSQSLGVRGGTAPVHGIAREGSVVRVDGEPAVWCLTAPAAFGAAPFDGGDAVADFLLRGRFPESARVEDAFGAASALLAFPRTIPPGGSAEIDLVVPLGPGAPRPDVEEAGAAEWVERELSRCRAAWRERTDRVSIELPPAQARVVESLKSQLAWVLVNRAGPAIQPGTRAYARSWIRDGSLTSSALLRLGHPEAAREFLEWFAPHQYPSGKSPCVVDSRGADPVPEHDSTGELIFLVAECFRYTGDRALAERMWPRVRAGVDYLDSLRRERLGGEWESPDRAEFRGILPPSISHEGYSAKPMHSYWDDFWALRGFRDAAYLAAQLGEEEERERIEAILDEFGRDLATSVDAAMRRHAIDWVPGCADLGDFDATSTTIALSPTGAAAVLPREGLERTFERYWEFFRARRRGAAWDAYTPYEIRNVGAFVRLGRRERASALLDFFLDDQRPRAWRQWPEVVCREERTPRFLGDLPHTWVGSDYVRSVLDMLAFVDEQQDAVVVGSGAPPAWLEGRGITVRDLPTPFGALDFSMRGDGRSAAIEIGGELRVPAGGIVLCAPLEGPVREALVNGVAAPVGPAGEVVVRELPATVRIR